MTAYQVLKILVNFESSPLAIILSLAIQALISLKEVFLFVEFNKFRWKGTLKTHPELLYTII